MRRGANYRTGNRPDVPLPATQPNQQATGLPYGEAGQLHQAQQQIPLPQTPTPGHPPTAPPGAPQAPGPQGAPPGGPDFQQVLQAAQAVQPPTSTLNAPTGRPDESVTAGLGQMNLGATTPTQTLGTLLSQLAQSPNTNPEVQFLANFVQSGRL